MDTLGEYWKVLLGLLLAPIILPLAVIGSFLLLIGVALYLIGDLTWSIVEEGINLLKEVSKDAKSNS